MSWKKLFEVGNEWERLEGVEKGSGKLCNYILIKK